MTDRTYNKRALLQQQQQQQHQQQLAIWILLFCWAANSQITVLNPGVVDHRFISQDKWEFYAFRVPANQGFTISVEHGTGASKTHDVDVYIKKGQIPDRTNYDFKDTTPYTSIKINGPAEATDRDFAAGVYGFRGDNTPFTIELTLTNGCEMNCNDHGSCLNGACTCDTGFAGPACGIVVPAVALKTIYSSGIEEGEWIYYSVDIYSANNLIINVSMVTGDVDLFVGYLAVPSFVSYTYSDFTRGNQPFNISITQPLLGTWYLGFYGFSKSEFSFSVAEVRACPMKCSLHGSCVGSYCRCSSDYVGLACEEARNALTFGRSVHGYVDQNYWNFYKFVANSANPVNIVLSNNISTNCDLYVLNLAKPTKFIFTYRNISEALVTNVVVSNPGFETWWMGIYGATACEYDLTAYQYLPSPPPSSPCGTCVHGSCNQQVCVCENGWVGKNCDVLPLFLLNNVPSNSIQIRNGDWKYFLISIRDTSRLSVVVQEKSTSGLVWLFIARDTFPTLSSYLTSDTNSAHSVHRISIEFDTPVSASRTYIIGVFGSPFIVQQTVEFTVTAFYTPF